jgi:Iron-containing redox enzyme
MTNVTAGLDGAPPLPSARGEMSEFLLERLACDPGEWATPPPLPSDPHEGEDFQLSLYLCYELHYGGLEGVDDAWEWDASLLGLRGRLERALEEALIEDIGDVAGAGQPPEVPAALRALPEEYAGGRSIARHVARAASLEEVRELVVLRSAYQLKEADPHSWLIPRLRGAPKVGLVEVQSDEYGAGDPDRLHQSLYRRTMEALDLDARPGAYLDLIPGFALATVNIGSLFGLHRRWRGAGVGHLAMFEMTSPDANRRYANGMRRLGLPSEVTDFYDEHVEADALHDVIAVNDVAGALSREEPGLAGQILFGARALFAVEERFTECVLDAWSVDESSLHGPLHVPAAA